MNKRFKNVEENLEWGTVQYFTYHDEKITDNELEKLVNHLLNQNDELKKENKQLKQEVTHWKKILDNHQQIVAKTLREQYHWLKNEDKISNHDKTVALLELESISARLEIDLN